MSVFRTGNERPGTLPDRAAGNSTQKCKKFTEICIDAGAASQKLRSLCQTRWAVRLASVDAISTAKKEILATLEELGAGASHLSSRAAWPASCSAHRGLRSSLCKWCAVQECGSGVGAAGADTFRPEPEPSEDVVRSGAGAGVV